MKLNSLKRFIPIVFAAFAAIWVTNQTYAQCTVTPQGLVSWWQAETNALDNQALNDGVLLNGVSFAQGKVGLAFSFDGIDDKISLGDSSSLVLTNGFTFEAWIKPTGYPVGHGLIFFRGDGRYCTDPYYFSYQPNGVLRLHVEDEAVYCGVNLETAVLPLNEWRHVAAVLDSSSLRIYVDGVLAASTNTVIRPLAQLQADGDVVIGNMSGPKSELGFKGLIDELAIYNRALNPAEIQAIYLAGEVGKCFALPPTILAQPKGQTGYWGKDASFSVIAEGSSPLHYRWYKDGFLIGWATNATLQLSSLALSDAGNYSVLVSNAWGSVKSSDALLVVNPAGVSFGLYPGITIEGVVGKTYGIQFATSVEPTAIWTTLTTVTLTESSYLWIDSTSDVTRPENPRRFYRVVAVP